MIISKFHHLEKDYLQESEKYWWIIYKEQKIKYHIGELSK